MGKAQIIVNLGEGLYQAMITYNTTLPAARKAALETRRPGLEQQLSVAETTRQIAETNVNQAQAELNQLIEQLSAATPETAPAIRTAIVEKQSVSKQLGEILTAARLEKSRISLDLSQVTTEIARIEALLSVEDTRNIWCADYSTGLTGQVDTIEINGEPEQILIAPGGAGEPVALLTSAEAMTTANWARNFALHPYWQKWKPTYRTGLIISKSEDTATVSLDNAVSSYHDLPINQDVILSDVPIQYLNCNGLAFEVGDAVVVRLTGQDWNSPVVIGFKYYPEICCPDTLSIQYTTINMFLGESQELSLAEDLSHSCPVYWSISQYPQPADWTDPTAAELAIAATGDETRGILTNLDGSPLTAPAAAVLYVASSEWINCEESQATVQVHGFDKTDEVTMQVSGREGNTTYYYGLGFFYYHNIPPYSWCNLEGYYQVVSFDCATGELFIPERFLGPIYGLGYVDYCPNGEGVGCDHPVIPPSAYWVCPDYTSPIAHSETCCWMPE